MYINDKKVDFKYFIKNNLRFISFSLVFSFIFISSAFYVSNLLFRGTHSYELYTHLKKQKIQLENDIKILQYENATLQKDYLELKNLEPEEL